MHRAFAGVELYCLFQVMWFYDDDASVPFGVSSSVATPLVLSVDQVWLASTLMDKIILFRKSQVT